MRQKCASRVYFLRNSEARGDQGECFDALWVFQGGGADHVPPAMLRRGKGNKRGLFSLSVLVERLFSPLPCCVCVYMRVCACE